ncbi:MAG: archease [Halohasta sp.]
MSFRLRDQTADVAVEATADSLGGLFAAIADGLAAAMCETVPDDGGDRFDVECRAESREALLYEYLDQLIYERDVRLVLPVDNEAVVESHDDEWTISASARGVGLDRVTARDIKAVTYSEMVVDRRDERWYAYVVFDV